MSAACTFVHTAFQAFSRTRSTACSRFTSRRPRSGFRTCRWISASAQQSGPETGQDLEVSSSEKAVPRRLRKGDKLDLKFVKQAYGGASVAYVPQDQQFEEEDVGMPVYGPKGACPGETIRCAISKVRRRSKKETDKSKVRVGESDNRSYAEAYYIERLSASPDAIPAPCSHFGNYYLGGGGCNGCTSLNVPYALQLSQKQSQVEGLFAKIARQDGFAVEPILGCMNTLHYRNKMEFTFGRRWYERDATRSTGNLKGPGDYEYTLGLHAPQRYDKIIHIEECFIQHPDGNDIIQYIRRRSSELLLEPYDTVMSQGYLRNVAIRTAKNANDELEVMVSIITSPCDVPNRLVPLAKEIIEKFPSVVCVMQNIRGVTSDHITEESLERLLAGSRGYIEQSLCGLTFRISSASFFQTNAEQAEVLYNEVRTAAGLTGEERILDLFCGTGTIGLSLASAAKHVFGIDVVPSAIRDAQANADANGISNVSFNVGNLDKFKKLFEDSPLPEPDVVIVDPPRAGLHQDLIKYIAHSNANRIIYVSCNPLTQVRDISRLQDFVPGKFRVSLVQPVDMFPNTHHVECVCALHRV